MLHHKVRLTNESGFTLIEILVVVGISAVLFVLGSINLGNTQSTTSVTSAMDTLLANIKSQQLLAMSGDEGSQSSQQPHGVYLQNTSYTLFAGSTYNSSDTNNFTVNIAPDTITTTFPNSTLLFEVGDGAIPDFNSSDDTITITGVAKTQTITLDRFGATSVQ